MDGWQDQILTMYESFEYQDILQKTLVNIDKKIINEDDISEILLLGYERICKITHADYLVFHIGNDDIFLYDKCKNYKSIKNQHRVEIDKEKRDWGSYIDAVTLCYIDKIRNSNFRKIQTNTKEEGVSSISRQLNIAILRNVEKGVDTLYRAIIDSFSQLGDVYKIFDLFCKEIINIFPNIRHGDSLDIHDMNINISISKNEENPYLIGVGSSNKYSAGGIVDENHSISGKVISMSKNKNIESGYFSIYFKKRRYIYFLGDPRKNKYYKQITDHKSQSQLSIPLFLSTGHYKKTPFAIITFESRYKNHFKNIQARSIIYNSDRLSELLHSAWKLSQGRKHIVEGFLINNNRYIKHILREYEHRIGHALLALSKVNHDLEKGWEYNLISTGVSEVYNHIKTDRDILKDALRGFVDKQKFVSLSEKVEKAKHFIKDKLVQEKINFIFNPNDVDQIYLDHLFPQYLYSLFYNSILSISRKRNRLRSLEGYQQDNKFKPYIEVSAKIIADPHNTAFTEVPKGININNRKCSITIKDNGDGIEKEHLSQLGRYKRSFQGSTGTGLYSFKQYLLIHDSRMFFESEYQEYFKIEFITNIPK